MSSFAPNSTGFPAFLRSMGRTNGWFKLTIRSATLWVQAGQTQLSNLLRTRPVAAFSAATPAADFTSYSFPVHSTLPADGGNSRPDGRPKG